ncbi:MAG: PCRF domain-containing protein, partial [Candidatus Omnitrophica bacterium]|nr:PCRF domain-containing protein [Candidatus Omnitrophota bacterium]
MSAADFWDNTDRPRKIVKELKTLKAIVEPWEMADKKYQELKELIPLLKENDNDLLLDLSRNTDSLLKIIDKLEFQVLLGGPL